ncbi:unnamed protein product [Camellia sinensis]
MGDFFQSGSFHIRTDPLIGMFLLNLKVFYTAECWKRIKSDDPNKFSLQLCWVKNGVKCFMHSLLRQGTALAGIVTLLHACLDMKAIILGKYHYVLYFLVLTPLKLDLLPTEARISGKEYKERVVNNLKILIVHYSGWWGKEVKLHQSHSKAVKRAISEHCGVWTISMLSYFYCFQCIGIRCCGDAAVMVIVTMRCCGVVVGCLLVLLMFGRVQDFLSNL